MSDQTAPPKPDEAQNPARDVSLDRADLAREIAALIGAACFVAGVGWIYKPAGLIVLGLILFVFSYLTMGLRRGPVSDDPRENE